MVLSFTKLRNFVPLYSLYNYTQYLKKKWFLIDGTNASCKIVLFFFLYRILDACTGNVTKRTAF